MNALAIHSVNFGIIENLNLFFTGHCKGSVDTLYKYKEECETKCLGSAPRPSGGSGEQKPAKTGKQSFRIVDKGPDRTVTIVDHQGPEQSVTIVDDGAPASANQSESTNSASPDSRNAQQRSTEPRTG